MNSYVERTAKLIQNEKKAIVKLSNEINSIVMEHNLSLPEKAKYLIDYTVCTAGNAISLNISDTKEFKSIEKIDYYNVTGAFEYYFHLPSEKEIKEKTIELTSTLKAMKKLAAKYIVLNNQTL